MLEEVLSKNLEQTVDFYVYSTETDTVRTATLMPNLKWGGRGCLGAEVGHGYLHGLPQKCCKTHGAWRGVAWRGVGLLVCVVSGACAYPTRRRRHGMFVC